jgi:hypothetical protein
MKKNEMKLFIALLIFTTLGVISCVGEGTKPDGTSSSVSSGTDQIFGDLPELVSNYERKLAENKEDQKKNTDLDKAFKLSQEEKQLKEEANDKVESFFNNLKEPLTVPVTQEGDEGYYKISELVLTKVNFKNFMVKANIEVLDSTYLKQNGFLGIHVQIYKDGAPSNRWIVMGYRNGEKKGNVWEVEGGTYTSFLVGVTKLVVKPEAAWKESIKSK